MPRVTAVVFDSHDNSLVMQFNNGGIRRYRKVSEVEFLCLSGTDDDQTLGADIGKTLRSKPFLVQLALKELAVIFSFPLKR